MAIRHKREKIMGEVQQGVGGSTCELKAKRQMPDHNKNPGSADRADPGGESMVRAKDMSAGVYLEIPYLEKCQRLKLAIPLVMVVTSWRSHGFFRAVSS